MGMSVVVCYCKTFENTKGVIRSRNSTKGRQCISKKMKNRTTSKMVDKTLHRKLMFEQNGNTLENWE